jgi:hypothetical protein
MVESLDPTLHPYVYPAAELAGISVPNRPSYQSLKQFGIKIRDLLESERKAFATFNPPKPSSAHYLLRMQLTVLLSYYQEASTHLHSHVNDLLPALLDKIISLMEFMKAHPEHDIRASEFGRSMQSDLDAHPHYSRAFFLRDSLRAKIRYLLSKYPAPAGKKELRAVLANGSVECDAESGYSPPSRFDLSLRIFLERTPWAEMVEPVVLSVLEGTPDSALVTIHALAESVLADLAAVSTRTALVIVYCGLVRLVFDECYVRSNALSERRVFDEVRAVFEEDGDLCYQKIVP